MNVIIPHRNRKDPSGFHPYPLSQSSLPPLGKMSSGVVSLQVLQLVLINRIKGTRLRRERQISVVLWN